MSEFTTSTEAAPRRGALLPTIVIVGVALALLVIFARTFTDYLWFDNLSFRQVFTTQLAAQLGLFAVFGIVLAAALYGSMALAYRLRPKVRRANLDSELLVQLRDVLDRRSKIMMLIPAAVVGFIGGSVGAGMTQTFLAWTQSTDFGTTDARFNMDASFYVFQLPWWNFVLGYVTFTVIASTIAAILVHFLTGSMTAKALRGMGNVDVRQTGNAAQRQLSIMLGVVLLLFATSAVLDRFSYLTTTNALFTGVTYTDDNARIPAHLIVAAIAVICALLCFFNAYKVRWSIPAVSVALLVVSSMILSIAYPWFMQQFDVAPDEQEKEKPYVSANIEATRAGFGIDNIDVTNYEAETTAEAGQLKEDAQSLPAIRLMDPAVIPRTFEQLQQVRGYYSFPETLDIDRYTIDGRETDAVVAVRELDLDSVESGESWNNKRTVYTHGYGMVAAYGNQKQPNGEPVFFSGGIPTVGLLPEHEPRIYFGEEADHWVVAGAPKESAPVELDTPGGGEQGGETKFTYDGDGGVPVGNFLTKGLFAIRFGDVNMMLSDRVNEESSVLFNRIPADRVQEAAPWLTLDSDPYPSVVDGKIVWIIDAYTTSATYPNSTKIDLAGAISDARTSANQLLMGRQVNYIRNSVKATVDAYDGTVKLYEWDEEDPILQTWMKVYPGVVTPKSDISSELKSHLRYPADLLKVQREALGRYHTQDPYTWIQQTDIWAVPNDPVQGTGDGTIKEPPYFLTIGWPGEDEPRYSNTTVFVPRERENLSVYMAANADATSEDYGQIKVLKLSDERQIAGPGQTFNAISTDEQVANALLPFNRDGSNATAIYGNLLTLPVGGGLMYVQPIYTQTKATTGGYPALRFVVVRFGEKVGIGATLQSALDQVFDGDAGAETGEQPVDEEEIPGLVDPGTEQPVDLQATDLLTEAMALFVEADEALKAGDLALYQSKTEAGSAKAQKALELLNG